MWFGERSAAPFEALRKPDASPPSCGSVRAPGGASRRGCGWARLSTGRLAIAGNLVDNPVDATRRSL
jgi:hypothetical protein